MYVYKVKAVNGQYYIGVGDGDGRSKQTTTDPHGVFPSHVNNGQYNQKNTTIEILYRGNTDKIERFINTYIVNNGLGSDSKFLGLRRNFQTKTDTTNTKDTDVYEYETVTPQPISESELLFQSNDELNPPEFDHQMVEDTYEDEEDEFHFDVDDDEFDDIDDIDDEFFTNEEE